MVPSHEPEWLIWVSLIHLEKEMQLYILEDGMREKKIKGKKEREKLEQLLWSLLVKPTYCQCINLGYGFFKIIIVLELASPIHHTPNLCFFCGK